MKKLLFFLFTLFSFSFVLYFFLYFHSAYATTTSWYDSAWAYRMPVTINNTGNTNTLTNYQVNITLSAPAFTFSQALADGSDIRVTDFDGTTLIPYYIENFNPTTQTGNIWVKVPSIKGSSTTTIYVYFGNPSPQAFDVPPIGPFQKYGNKPLITATGSGVLPEDIVFDDVTNKYYMILSDRQTSNYKLGLYSSPDLVTWSNAGTILTSTINLDAPHLMKYNNKWYVYYEESQDIQLATSNNITGPYTKINGSPVLRKGPDAWQAGRVTEMYVFKRDDGVWMMFYMGDTGQQIEQVGYATAPAPEGPWTKYASNPAIAFGIPGSYDAGTVADPFLYKFGDTYYIFYASSVSKSTPWTEAYVTTKDFITFTRGNVVVGRGSQPSFDDFNAHRGALIRVGDYYYMSYAGFGGDDPYRLYEAGMAKQYAKSNAKGFPPQQVFDFYDDFSTSTLNSQLRTERNANGNGNISIANGILTLHSGTTSPTRPYIKLFSVQEFGPGELLETRVQHPNANSNSTYSSGIGLGDSNFNTVNTDFWVPGKFNNAASFSDKNLDVNLGNKASISLTKNFTVDAWIKVNNYASQIENYFLGKNPGWAFYIENNGSLRVLYNGTTEVYANGAFGPSDLGKWVHVAFTYNGSTTKIYKNGVSLSITGTYSGDLNTTAGLYAGQRGDKEWYFNGAIDEVRISNIVRYTSNFTPPTAEYTVDANTAALWHFNESGGSVFDATANHNDGFVTGGRGMNIHFYNSPMWTKASSNGVGSESTMNQNTDTAYHIQRVWFKTTTEARFQNDSNPWESLSTHIPGGTMPLWLMTSAVNNGTSNGTLNIDWIKVRKYTDIEPTLSFKNEEFYIPPPQTTSLPTLIQIKSSNDARIVNNFPIFKTSSQFTFTAWVNFTPKMPERYILWANGVDFRVGYQRIAFGMFQPGGFGVLRFTPGDLNGGVWRFVAFTYANNQQKIYLDDRYLGSQPVGGKFDKMITDRLVIGRTDVSTPYDGFISNISIYNIALSAGQIKQLYTAGR